MSAFERWQAANNRYLANEIAALRARLERLAASAASETAEPSWRQRWLRPAEPVSPAPPAVAIVEPGEASGDEPTPALIVLARRLQLSDFERDVLLLCAAMELDTRIAPLCARAQADLNKPYPTFALALALFDRPAWDALSPERPLRYWQIVNVHQSMTQALVASALRADERIVSYLKGANYLDDRIAPLVNALPEYDGEAPPSQQACIDAIVDRLRAADAPIVELVGSDPASKRLVAARVADALNLRVCRIGAEAIPQTPAELEALARLWQRECALLSLALYVDAYDADRAGGVGAAVQRALGAFSGLVFFDVREPWPRVARETLPVDVAKPVPAEQRALWLAALGGEHEPTAARVAVHFDFDAATIARAAELSLALANGDAAQVPALVWAQCVAHARPVLDQLAQPVEAKATWDDLALPEAEKSLLRQIADQVEHRGTVYDDYGFRARMNRGLGISVLFAGESGTGKTMAAEVIANALGLLLYRIDLSAVVNKYIGETEKNLRRLFDAAECGGAILLFDEADALFGKRGEVKDSHDRYSNIEVNYLLQRMEAFRGLAILATNMKSALDGAFVRRLRFIVKFPFPGLPEREAIWRRALPPALVDSALATGAIDYARLARFNLTGASIHSIALNAAFLAARANAPLSMPLLLEAARTEFRKLEKPVSEGDFRWLERAEGAA